MPLKDRATAIKPDPGYVAETGTKVKKSAGRRLCAGPRSSFQFGSPFIQVAAQQRVCTLQEKIQQPKKPDIPEFDCRSKGTSTALNGVSVRSCFDFQRSGLLRLDGIAT